MDKVKVITADLADRVEGLAGPCRETDSRVFRAMGSPLPLSFAGLGISLTWQPDGSATMPIGDMQVRYDPPAYTASLDAVVALIEKELPDWGWKCVKPVPGQWQSYAEVWAGGVGVFGGNAATTALALLAAFLRARAALLLAKIKEPTDG